MKFLMVLAPLIAMGLIYMMYQREKDAQKALFSLFLLVGVVSLGIVGNIMRSVMPLFLTHLVAIVMAYGATLYYILREKKVWLFLLAPIATMILYLLLTWIGNEHLPSVF